MAPTAPATAAPAVEKDNKRITTGWTFYDWANSVYPLVITSSIFPIYWGSITQEINKSDVVNFLGFNVPGPSLLTYAISASFLIIALISPFLTSLADYSGRKKLFLQIFCYIGAASCAGLYFFTKDTLTLSTFIFIAATVGFSGSIVFYNSYLPEISSEAKFDSLSARGFSMGYVGSVLLLVLCLMLIQGPTLSGTPMFGLKVGQATRLSFLLTGIWWVGFAQIPFFTLPPDAGRPADAPASSDGWVLNGFRELGKVWDQLKQLTNLKRFLLAYFTYNMGVQTVMYVATIFGDKVLHLESKSLIITILLLQVVGILGAWLFAKISDRIGNTRALSWAVFIWMLICIGGYFVQAGWSFYALASVIGLTMGAVQSLSRSTYSKIIPENTPNSAAFFSFFDVVEKLGIVLGTLSFGLIGQITGNMRNSILSLIVFFIFGLAFLLSLRGRKLREDAATALPPPPASAPGQMGTPQTV